MALTATDLFNDATTREIGGVGPDQVNLIASDLIGVKQMLSAAVPQINNASDLHTHVIINQLNEEIATVENANAPAGTLILGTDLGQFAGRAINDIHRDIIDIAQGDPGVQALFNPTPLPALNTPAAPFHDNADQTKFITQWIQDSNHLGQAAITIENNGFTGEAIILDRDRRLPEMITVLDPLSDKFRLVCIVMERCSGGVQGWERRRVKQRLNTRIALSDINNIPVDIIDRTPNKLSEICSRRNCAGCWSVRVLDGRNLFIELIDDDMRVQIGKVIDLGIRR